MLRQAEVKEARDPFIEHGNNSIAALVAGTAGMTIMIIFFSIKHLLPASLPDLSPIETTARLFAPLLLGMAESARQNHLANRALVNGEKDPSKIGMV